MLPFTRDQFLAVFATYQQAAWPAMVAAYALAAAMLLALWARGAGAQRLVFTGLGLMWVWTGIAYHALHFAPINPAAWGFAALFVLQGAGLLAEAAREAPAPVAMARWRLAAGLAWVCYAIVVYPLWGLAAGEPAASVPAFGITPCPLVLFTWGVLLLRPAPVARRLLAVPLLWSVVGGSAAWLLDMPQDRALPLAALVAMPALWPRRNVRRAAAGRQAPL